MDTPNVGLLIVLILVTKVLFVSCQENSTPASDMILIHNNLTSVGQGGFWMPNGTQHKEGCGCNTCDAIRINLEEFCFSDTIVATDTIVVVDTVEITAALAGEWLKFSAYEASKAFVKEHYPERATDRFSRMGTFCNYGSNPAGRAGFKFADNGDSTFLTEGYTYEYLFGAAGFVWGAAQGQPTERTYNYGCSLHLDENNDWVLLNISMGPCGDYIRDTRHD